MVVPVITIAVLSAMLAGQPFILSLGSRRESQRRPKNLFKWFYLMGLIEIDWKFLETMGLNQWLNGIE
jgi:hypothetical protein